jgi:hypothetical protein
MANLNQQNRVAPKSALFAALVLVSLFICSPSAFAAGGRVVQTDDLPNFGSVRVNGVLWGGSGLGLNAHTPWVATNTSSVQVQIPYFRIGTQDFRTAYQYENGMISLNSVLSNPGNSVSNLNQFSSAGQRGFVIAAASADYQSATSLPNILGAPGFIATTPSAGNYYAYAPGSVSYSVGSYANIVNATGNCTSGELTGPGVVSSVTQNQIQLLTASTGLMAICRDTNQTGYGIATRFTWTAMSLVGSGFGALHSQVAIWDVGTAGDGDVDIFLAVGGTTYDSLGRDLGLDTNFASGAVGGFSLGTSSYRYNNVSFADAFNHFKVRSGVICGVANEGRANETCIPLVVDDPVSVPLPGSAMCVLLGLWAIRRNIKPHRLGHFNPINCSAHNTSCITGTFSGRV